MAKTLQVLIAGDASGLEAAFKKAHGSASKFGKGLNVASVAAGGALVALGAAAKVGFGEFVQGEKVSAQTAAVLKSTGNAAKVSQQQIDSLATSLMKKSGVDDEAIKSGQNLLLTFTKVRNEVGKGNDIFNQGTRAALDMSVAMGKDMSSSAMLVGKALNDPVKGMTALTKSGIQFTDAQKAQVKGMVASGNVMGAQKVILKELQTQFGGSAAAAGGTFAGRMNIAKESLTNFAGELVGAAMPALSALASGLSAATGFMTRHETAAKVAVGVVAGLSVGVLALKAAMAVGAVATAAMTVAQGALSLVMRASPIGIIITAVVALGAGLVIAWQRSETFRDIVKGAFDVVKSAASAVAGAVESVVDWVRNLAGNPVVKTIGKVLAAPFIFAITFINHVIDAIRAIIGAVKSAIDAIRSIPNPFSGGNDPSKTDILNPYLRPTPYGTGGAHGGRVLGRIGAGDIVPMMLSPGELIIPNGGASVATRGGGGGVTQIFNFPNYVGDKRELEEQIRSMLIRAGRRMPGALGGLA